MSSLDAIRDIPIIRLSMAQIEMLPDDDQGRVFGKLFDMAKDGDLAMLAINPPGTTYEVRFERGRGWALSPICRCQNEPRFVEAYFEYHDVTLRDGPGCCRGS